MYRGKSGAERQANEHSPSTSESKPTSRQAPTPNTLTIKHKLKISQHMANHHRKPAVERHAPFSKLNLTLSSPPSQLPLHLSLNSTSI